jgi:broad specificity phosphatase PhoE
MVHSASFWLVRHGESTWNRLGLAQGHCDQAQLTRRGLRQAWAVAAELRGRPIGALYSSDLRRALQTAAPLATALGLPVRRDARLRERCLGILEGTDAAAIDPAVSGLRAHRVVDPDARPPGGESGDIAVVAHGGTLRMLNAYLRRIPVPDMSWEPLANGRILRSPAGRLDHITNPSEREHR